MTHKADVAPLLERFFTQRLMQQRQASPHTISSYRDTFRQFLKFAQQPLRTFETVVDLIGNTRTDAGLRVTAELDNRKYPKGVTTTNAEMDALSLHRNEFHGDWNYELHPR